MEPPQLPWDSSNMTTEEALAVILAKLEEIDVRRSSTSEPLMASWSPSASLPSAAVDDREVDLHTTSDPVASSPAPSTPTSIPAPPPPPTMMTDEQQDKFWSAMERMEAAMENMEEANQKTHTMLAELLATTHGVATTMSELVVSTDQNDSGKLAATPTALISTSSTQSAEIRSANPILVPKQPRAASTKCSMPDLYHIACTPALAATSLESLPPPTASPVSVLTQDATLAISVTFPKHTEVTHNRCSRWGCDVNTCVPVPVNTNFRLLPDKVAYLFDTIFIDTHAGMLVGASLQFLSIGVCKSQLEFKGNFFCNLLTTGSIRFEHCYMQRKPPWLLFSEMPIFFLGLQQPWPPPIPMELWGCNSESWPPPEQGLLMLHPNISCVSAWQITVCATVHFYLEICMCNKHWLEFLENAVQINACSRTLVVELLQLQLHHQIGLFTYALVADKVTLFNCAFYLDLCLWRKDQINFLELSPSEEKCQLCMSSALVAVIINFRFVPEVSPWCREYIMYMQFRTPWPPPASAWMCYTKTRATEVAIRSARHLVSQCFLRWDLSYEGCALHDTAVLVQVVDLLLFQHKHFEASLASKPITFERGLLLCCRTSKVPFISEMCNLRVEMSGLQSNNYFTQYYLGTITLLIFSLVTKWWVQDHLNPVSEFHHVVVWSSMIRASCSEISTDQVAMSMHWFQLQNQSLPCSDFLLQYECQHWETVTAAQSIQIMIVAVHIYLGIDSMSKPQNARCVTEYPATQLEQMLVAVKAVLFGWMCVTGMIYSWILGSNSDYLYMPQAPSQVHDGCYVQATTHIRCLNTSPDTKQMYQIQDFVPCCSSMQVASFQDNTSCWQVSPMIRDGVNLAAPNNKRMYVPWDPGDSEYDSDFCSNGLGTSRISRGEVCQGPRYGLGLEKAWA